MSQNDAPHGSTLPDRPRPLQGAVNDISLPPLQPRECEEKMHISQDTFYRATHQEIGEGTITVLRATEKSQVFLISSPTGVPCVLKRFDDRGRFAEEAMFFILCKGLNGIPKVSEILWDDAAILMEYVPRQVDFGTHGVLERVAAVLGTLHSVSARWSPPAFDVFAESALGRLATTQPPGLVTPHAWRALIALMSDVFSPDFVTLALVDVKPEHVLMRHTGEVVLVDFETVAFGIPSALDLVSLSGFPNFPVDDVSRQSKVLQAYSEGISKSFPQVTVESVRSMIDLTCRCYGISSPWKT